MSTAIIFDIQKFSVHDGPGIRTTVFMKGCPLHCIWCHNPESWAVQPQILFAADKCTACRRCEAACPRHCHLFDEATHTFRRTDCIACGACTKACYNDALELCGSSMTPEEVMAEVIKDKPFYDNSHGGMTVSGGEPMMHFEFTRDLLALAHQKGIHTAMETSGFTDQDKLMDVLPLVDLFLWDVKAVNPEKHKRFTSQSNEKILANLRAIDAAGAAYHLRCPVVPGLNDSEDDLIGIAELANSLKHPLEIEIEPYHPLGISKANRLGRKPDFEAPFTDKALSDTWLDIIRSHTAVPVRKH